MMTATLSVDHRVIDGSVGAEFLGILKGLLENPLTMLL
jgi:pyruvate dehydrogenase E2 component (dihydrolipoamide acetyltransferase)